MFLSLPLAICVFVLLGADDVIVDVGFTHSLFPFYFFIVQYLVSVFLFTDCVKIRVLC
jgi:hypothetical protein